MFIAALSIIAKLWKELRCPSTDDWIKKVWSIYTIEYYSAIRKNDYTTFAATWMGLKIFFLRFIYLFEGERGRGRGRERTRSRLPPECEARCRAASQDPEITT